ncbi:MAG: TonB family protein [Calditrichia bacterium]|nr:energy transducer TonB [Calditrichia bacterium]
MAHQQLIFKEPAADLRKKYPRWVEIALVTALMITASLFFAFQRFENSVPVQKKIDIVIEAVEIPPTEQHKPPPKPQRPVIPVESDSDEDIPDDLTIEETSWVENSGLADVPPPPAEDPEPTVPFYALSERPEVLHQVTPDYPELAKRAGIEGQVVVKVLINTVGNVEKVEILKSHPLLDEAALAAARQFKFSPGKQRDRVVKVWTQIPFHFRLKN